MSKSKQTAPVALMSRPSVDDEKAVDLYLYGAIPELDWNTFDLINTDGEFVDAFREAEKNYDRINIHINSPGGWIDEGLVMYNTIRASKKDVHTYNDGLAASMGSVILMAGNTVHAPASSIIMFHSAMGGVMGNKDEIRDYADMLEVYESALANAMAKKMGMTSDELKTKYFDGKDHFMTGEDAFNDGLIDKLESYDPEIPEGVTNMTYNQIVNHYSNHKSSNSIMKLVDFFSGKAKAEKETVEVEAKELNELRTASEEAVNKMETLEKEKSEALEKVNNLQETIKTMKSESDEQLQKEVEAHAATQKAFDDFKKGSGEEHSVADKVEDAYQGGSDKPMADYQKEEQEVRAKAQTVAGKKSETKTEK